ncbi:Ankyrin repeat domain-containing protein 50 [Fusarium oxysporum f. sp. albedinis]|nr:Ankyrin repeat domain-containing protein 50 [Fusarium oxysporum f. sp. albedinis]
MTFTHDPYVTVGIWTGSRVGPDPASLVILFAEARMRDGGPQISMASKLRKQASSPCYRPLHNKVPNILWNFV